MSGAIPSLPNTSSWRGAQLKAQGQLYLFTFAEIGVVNFATLEESDSQEYNVPTLQCSEMQLEDVILLVVLYGCET
jgi:hypothetical protein